MGYLSSCKSCNVDSAIVICHRQSRTRNPRIIRHFSHSDLAAATGGFSVDCFLGKGSHGSVYRAVLDGGKLVAAVKRTSAAAGNEIEILSRFYSPWVVNLIGFSSDNEIVVEYMRNGSLYDLLHTRSNPPGWTRRVRHALQVAKAVHALHSATPPVIHRDIKSSNVLIDEKWRARLGDFGLALRVGHVAEVPPAGTLGYLDPGYLAPRDLSTKSDVFSFGILLLEIITGRNAIDVNYSPPSVVDWAVPLIKHGEFDRICDRRCGPPPDPAVARHMAILAARCVRSAAEKRPGMDEVVECLELVHARPVWNQLRRRVRCVEMVKYELLDCNRKVSSVSGAEVEVEVEEEVIPAVDRIVMRSKSTGSELARRKGGMKMNKSRSMGVLQSRRLVSNNGRKMRRNSISMDVSKLRISSSLDEFELEKPLVSMRII